MATKTHSPKPTDMTPSWDLVKPSLALIREHYVAIIYLFLLPALLYTLGSLLIGPLVTRDDIRGLMDPTNRQTAGIVISALAIIWTIVNIGPTTYFQLRALNNEPESITVYYKGGLRYSLRLALYYVLFGLTIVAGLILAVIPGIIFIRRYALAGYYIVDQNLPIRKAMQLSAETTKPVSGAVWGVIGVQVALGLGAALFASIPALGVVIQQLIACLSVFLFALRYREIQPPMRKTKKR